MRLDRLFFGGRIWRKSLSFVVAAIAIAVMLAAFSTTANEAVSSDKKARPTGPEISPMGAIARGDVPRPYYQDLVKEAREPFQLPAAPTGLQGFDRLVHSPTAAGFQSENTIAVNKDFVVVGFNDIRGFGATVSVSGYAYSSDGGLTWTDGGQLPLLTGTDQVYGDPDVKTWTHPGTGQIYFFYSSLYTTTAGQSSLCIHVSTNGGATWSSPREVTSASSFTDFCDKEFMGVDPETGRIFISWTNFGAGTTMRVVYSDDFGLTWSPATVFPISGQGSVPRAAPRSNNVYITWRSGGDIKFVVSTNNGASWSMIFTAATGFLNPESPYGSDRIHGFPSMDVDTLGDAHVVFAARNADFSDIYYFKAFEPGTTYTAPVPINCDPGNDRSQFFPWLSVNPNTGRIDVIWYDQMRGLGTADLTDVFHTHSEDGGVTWSAPSPLTDRSFHAEYGNDTSQPNIGDYIQCAAGYDDEPNDEVHALYAAFAKTDEPSANTYAPDTYVDVSSRLPIAAPIAIPPDLYPDVFTNFTDYGCGHDNGLLEPGESADLDVTIWEYTNTGVITGIQGTVTTATPNVTVVDANAAFGNLTGLGTTSTNTDPLTIQVDTSFVCGDNIDLTLNIVSSAGEARLMLRIPTGGPVYTTLLDEKFDGVVAPALPPGWTTSNMAGTVNPWTTSTAFSASAPNAVYCADISTASRNRLSSPVIIVPSDCDLLDVSFWITHDLEDAGGGSRMAWDGALLKVLIGGTQTELAGSFTYDFLPFYPNQHYRMSGATANPLQDLACWSGDITPNFTNVRMQFPGLAGQQIQLLWELGTDGAVGTASGMFVDDVVVRSAALECSTCTPTGIADYAPPAPFRITAVVPNPFNPETAIHFTLPRRMAVTGEVWSVSGERVRVLASGRYFDPGENAIRWNGKNERGETVASGVYFFRLKTPVGEQVTRAVLLK